jgi:hypothetical protein
MKIQFSIRDVLVTMAVIALAAGWWIDHQRINQSSIQEWEYRIGNFRISELNTNGKDGWEACGAFYDENNRNAFVLYKKPLR